MQSEQDFDNFYKYERIASGIIDWTQSRRWLSKPLTNGTWNGWIASKHMFSGGDPIDQRTKEDKDLRKLKLDEEGNMN
ncbi:hypothetical protein CEXT_307561 [Caerostris extrusa]|uniref:Uncharacterized protein n=1 Tax=Caerostris extrusa TaxID=172846 RepID=A0AAV4XGG1_CAEEX|nr:hypothetical protein CEXT_307561 [Caerostris extrusa]